MRIVYQTTAGMAIRYRIDDRPLPAASDSCPRHPDAASLRRHLNWHVRQLSNMSPHPADRLPLIPPLTIGIDFTFPAPPPPRRKPTFLLSPWHPGSHHAAFSISRKQIGQTTATPQRCALSADLRRPLSLAHLAQYPVHRKFAELSLPENSAGRRFPTFAHVIRADRWATAVPSVSKLE